MGCKNLSYYEEGCTNEKSDFFSWGIYKKGVTASKKRYNYYPYGKILRSYSNGEVDRYLTTQHERDKETGYDYRGARFYDSDVARFLSVDPLARKYTSWSPYNYVLGNPIRYIDPDGREVVVPNVKDRAPILKMINSRALGLFAFDKSGKLYQVRATGDATKFSSYYRDKLVEGIESDKTITVNIAEKFTFGGKEYDTDADWGGAATAGAKDTDQTTWISGNENTNLKDKDGKPLRDKAADILAHELVGHAIPKVAGSDTGNAVENENKVRKEYKEKGQVGKSPLREAEPDHKE